MNWVLVVVLVAQVGMALLARALIVSAARQCPGVGHHSRRPATSEATNSTPMPATRI